jgi:hypothetical protein
VEPARNRNLPLIPKLREELYGHGAAAFIRNNPDIQHRISRVSFRFEVDIMLIVRLTCAFLMSILFCSAQEQLEEPTANRSLTEGPWEMTSASEIDGIFLITAGGFTSIRVYHRSGVKENWGNFASDSKATTQSDVVQDDHSLTLFDGTHLRIHFVGVTDLKPFDLDIIFSVNSHTWSGTWSRSGQNLNVELKRPEPNPGIVPNPFVGDWIGESSKPYLAPGSLHIRQSSDGRLCAWLNRAISPTDKRYGEFLRVYHADAPKLLLERPGEFGPSAHYSAVLSEDGQVLTGTWTQGGGGRLNAPDKFQKEPD